MCNNEGIHREMNGVIYYSATNQSKCIAEYFAEKTAFGLFDIFALTEYEFETAILVFPVHCQSVPEPVKNLLKRLRVKALAVIATYGRMCPGNVLYEIQRRYNHNVIAAAYVPTKHSYLSESGFSDFEKLNVILNKVNNPAPVKVDKLYRNPLSGICKGLRSRIGVKIYKDKRCDGCGTCNSACNYNALNFGKTNRKCIRCLKCFENCPKNALHFSLRLPMRVYLRKKKYDELIIYV